MQIEIYLLRYSVILEAKFEAARRIMKGIELFFTFQQKIVIGLTALALVLTACSSDTEETQGEQTVPSAVGFDAKMDSSLQPTTRTPANAIEDITNLHGEGGFGVFGCYTGLYSYMDSNVQPNFMYNEHVTYDSENSKWKYSPIKYWPNGEGMTYDPLITGETPHFVSFMAYAPYSDADASDPATNPNGYCIPAFSNQSVCGNPWLTYQLIPQENLDKQVDLLYAEPQLDQTKQPINDKVTFEFKHALACVGDKVTIVCADGMKDQMKYRVECTSLTAAKVVVKSVVIKYTLTAKARQILWNEGEANWETINSGSPTCTRTVTIVDTADPKDVYQYPTPGEAETLTINDKGVYYIPIELNGNTQKAEVFVTYCTASTTDGTNWSYGADITASDTIILREYTEAYQPGKHLYINVTLNERDINLTAAIVPWDKVNTTSSIPVEM